MPPMPAEPPPDDTIARLHGEWASIHTRLRSLEQLLSDALQLYARGEGPRPDEIMQDVEQLRAECAVRFKRLMEAIRSPRPGKSG